METRSTLHIPRKNFPTNGWRRYAGRSIAKVLPFSFFFFVSRVCFFSFARVCRLTCISVFTYAASTRRLDRAPCVAIISRPPSVCLHSLSHLPTPKGSRLLLSKTNIYIANARCAIVKSRGNSCFFLLRCRDRLSSRCSPSPDFTRGILTKEGERGETSHDRNL